MAGEAPLAAADIHPDALLGFVDELREAGYNIGTDQYIAAQDLVLALAARRTRFADPRRLGGLLGPVLCSSPREQDDFALRFRAWLERRSAATPAPPATDQTARAFEQELVQVERQRRIWLRVAGALLVFAAVLVMAWTVWWSGPAPPGLVDPDPAPPPPGREPLPAWVFIAAAAVSAAALGGWWLWRRRHAQLFLKRHATTTEPRLERITLRQLDRELFPRVALLRIARDFRRRVEVPSDDLDVRATVEETVRAGGAFTPLFGRRQVAPEYLVLVDRAACGDQQARFVDEFMERLVRDEVFATRYYFDGDPRVCFPAFGPDPADRPASAEHSTDPHPDRRAGRLERPSTLRELALRYPAHRLLLFSDARALFSPLTGELEPWTDQLEAWSSRAVLTPEPPALWGEREERLKQRLVILPASVEGLTRLLQSRRHSHVFAELPDGPRPPLPAELLSRSLRWTERDAPEPARVEAVLAGVRRHLGEAGFYWLAACAVYPALDWNLTLNLGHALRTRDGGPLLHPERLTALTRLPWFRHGSMPDWLRLRLVAAMTPEQEREVRSALQALLLTAVESGGEGFHLQIALEHPDALSTLARPILRRLSGHAEEGPLKDYVFLRFMAGRRPEPLAVRIPRAVRHLFQGRLASPTAAAANADPVLERRMSHAARVLAWATILVYPMCVAAGLLAWIVTGVSDTWYAFVVVAALFGTATGTAAWLAGHQWRHVRLKLLGSTQVALFLLPLLVSTRFGIEPLIVSDSPGMWTLSLTAGAVGATLVAFGTRRYRWLVTTADLWSLARRTIITIAVFSPLVVLMISGSTNNVFTLASLQAYLGCCIAALGWSSVLRSLRMAIVGAVPIVLFVWFIFSVDPASSSILNAGLVLLTPSCLALWWSLRKRGQPSNSTQRQLLPEWLFAPGGHPLYSGDAAWGFRRAGVAERRRTRQE